MYLNFLNSNLPMMKKLILTTLIAGCVLISYAQKKPNINANKKAVMASVENKFEQLSELSDKIWAYEEIAFQEVKSSKALSEFAEARASELHAALPASLPPLPPSMSLVSWSSISWVSLMHCLACRRRQYLPKSLAMWAPPVMAVATTSLA